MCSSSFEEYLSFMEEECHARAFMSFCARLCAWLLSRSDPGHGPNTSAISGIMSAYSANE